MNPDNINNFRFYILMRSDMDSMNPGKACAQAAHAQRHADQFILESKEGESFRKDYKSWCKETEQGFGSTICLEVDGERLNSVTEFLTQSGFPCGKVHDPTYPLVDGSVLHLLSLDTCGWVFGDKDELKPILQQFNLLP
jgi:peptidyl-tRNA hydrolase